MIEGLIQANPVRRRVARPPRHELMEQRRQDCYETALEIIDRATAHIERHDKGPNTFGGQKYSPLTLERRARF